ncbi:MAG: YhcH/YjgK/YiaL family protein [Phycisphaerae bacterium]|jgi:YhcH/YjgK/YiaL family protein
MVFDSIKNCKLYTNLSPRIASALKIAAETNFDRIEDGKYPVDDTNLYYLVIRYDTAPVMEKIEAHRKYIDIQFMAKGDERIGVDNITGLKVHTPYSEEKEVEFFKAEKSVSYIDVKEGMFAIFWPSDAHMPGRQIDKSRNVTKVVFKIKVD